jgi:hypothetical protein
VLMVRRLKAAEEACTVDRGRQLVTLRSLTSSRTQSGFPIIGAAIIHCVRTDKLGADRLRGVLRPDNPSLMVSLEETFYKEVSSAFHPLAAFCQIQRSTYEPLLEHAEEFSEFSTN